MRIRFLALSMLLASAALTAHAQTPVANPDADKQDWIVMFNGKDLKGWTPKIAKHEVGENFANTFRVENGLLEVRYDKDKYKAFDNQFGHLFYKDPFSYYRLVVEYRFVGQQVAGGPDWALRNSGAMLHSPDPRTMPRDQTFPISIEGQLLGGNSDGKPRSTANMCSPGTEIVYQGKLYKEHCLNSASPTFDGDQWVRAEFEVHGSGTIAHYVNGQKVLEYELPQYGGGVVDNYNTTTKPDGTLIDSGYISLQSESHPIDFRKVEILNLAGCMDKAATNYKSYYIKPVPEDCKFAEGAKPQMRRAGEYALNADSLPQEGIPKGRLEGPFEFHSKIIAGTVRRYWIFVPAQYNPKKPANVLVFQDGQRATNPNGSLRVPQAMENLIGKGQMPVTIGIFITPGNLSETYPTDLDMKNPNHRKEEYDALNDIYARFLIEEMLPEVAKKYNLTNDPEKRVIGGTSSGAICAFTVAWQRPDSFRRVISMIGSYTSIGYAPAADGKPMVPGGDLYPTLIRKNPIKPIRIYLQDGEHDLSNEHGSWFLANQQMLSAFEYANAKADKDNVLGTRYELRHNWGDGAHSDAHGGALLPEILKWIWTND
ncbi:MAG TPA: family 16 glycoside hydrolase [Steroidobacteraceae bacterium]|nr:family 16 glycoside hydrolase [Steroidobacteraceae bacterium]